MKIDGSSITSSVTGTSAPSTRSVKTTPPPGNTQSQDNVTLSSTSAQIRALSTSVSGASERRACKTLGVARWMARPSITQHPFAPLREDLVQRLAFLIQEYPTYGYRRLGVILR